MDHLGSPHLSAFRNNARLWIERNIPLGWHELQNLPVDAARTLEVQREWQTRMFNDGWVGLHWPKEYGGQGATYAEAAIFLEECARAQAP